MTCYLLKDKRKSLFKHLNNLTSIKQLSLKYILFFLTSILTTISNGQNSSPSSINLSDFNKIDTLFEIFSPLIENVQSLKSVRLDTMNKAIYLEFIRYYVEKDFYGNRGKGLSQRAFDTLQINLDTSSFGLFCAKYSLNEYLVKEFIKLLIKNSIDEVHRMTPVGGREILYCATIIKYNHCDFYLRISSGCNKKDYYPFYYKFYKRIGLRLRKLQNGSFLFTHCHKKKLNKRN